VVFAGTEKGKRLGRADAFTEADGSFVLSTYGPFDGAPAGEYSVTVELRRPLLDSAGRPGKNTLPERYAKADATPLQAVIKEGGSEVVLDLKR
jgi:hypothetical protein